PSSMQGTCFLPPLCPKCRFAKPRPPVYRPDVSPQPTAPAFRASSAPPHEPSSLPESNTLLCEPQSDPEPSFGSSRPDSGLIADNSRTACGCLLLRLADYNPAHVVV